MNPRLLLLYRIGRATMGHVVDCLLVVATPLLEKNPAKTLATRAPVVLSMARLVVLGFAVAVLRQVWRAGIGGWPDATLSISVVLALPIVGALERIRPSDAVSLARALVGRFGRGDVRAAWSAAAQASTEPSKFDDHRTDVQHYAPRSSSGTQESSLDDRSETRESADACGNDGSDSRDGNAEADAGTDVEGMSSRSQTAEVPA